MRKPVAISKTPPQALKSPIISGVVRGKMIPARKNSSRKIRHWGIAINATIIPILQEKIIAVGRSRIDFASRIL